MTAPRLWVTPQLGPGVYLQQPSESLPYPLEDSSYRLFASGRAAIGQGARALGLGPGGSILVPALHQSWEVDALMDAGLGCLYYECDNRLQPVEEQLSSLLTPDVKAMQLSHQLGFPQDAARWRRWCDDHGLLLFEGAAHAWLSSGDDVPVGSLGDLAVFCLDQTLGLPEGAALISATAPDLPPRQPQRGSLAVARSHAAWLAAQAPWPRLGSRRRRGREAIASVRRAAPEAGDGTSRAIPWLLARLWDPGVAARRRANFEFLLEQLSDFVPTPFERLPDGTCPFVFPVETDDKPTLLARLDRHGVTALADCWVPHPSLPSRGFADARRMRERTVGLPIHQRLGPDDLNRIADAVSPRRRPPSGLRTERLSGLDAIGNEWEALAERADNIFATREWLTTWWRHFGVGEQCILACRRTDGSLAAIIPLYLTAVGPAHALRFIGHGPSDQLGPICDSRERVAVARALRQALATGVAGDWDLLLGELLGAELGWSALLGARVAGFESSPVLRGRGRNFEELLASRSSNFRQQVRRRERKLRKEHDLQFRLADDPARLPQELTTLFDLHAARWGSESEAFSPERQEFHREFAALALERGWLRFWIAEVDGRPVAALFGFRFAGDELYYQSGRDPAWDSHAVGFVMLAHAIREALDGGAKDYRLLRGNEPYKARFADHDPGLETIVAARSQPARAALGAVLPLTALERPRRLIRQLVGGHATGPSLVDGEESSRGGAQACVSRREV